MRLVLMGTGPFAVPSFEAIRSAGHTIVHVVTRPIVVSSGKKAPPPSPVREWAQEHDLAIADPLRINDSESISWLRQLQSDLFVVCDYGQILSNEALSSSRLGGINLHGSLLPRHRGAAPVQWSILAGDREMGVSVIHMTPALDGGPILQSASVPSITTENALELEHRLSQLGIEPTLKSIAMLETLEGNLDGKPLGTLQDKSLATKAPRLAKEDGELNPFYSCTHMDRLVRALQPWPGTFANLEMPDGKSLRVLIPKVTPFHVDLESINATDQVGYLFYGPKLTQFRSATSSPLLGNLYICVQDGLLEILAIQPAGKRLMSADEFLRGYSRYDCMKIAGESGAHRLLNQLKT